MYTELGWLQDCQQYKHLDFEQKNFPLHWCEPLHILPACGASNSASCKEGEESFEYS